MELDDLVIHINLDSVSHYGVVRIGNEIVGYWKGYNSTTTSNLTINISLDETFQRLPSHMVTPCKFIPVDMDAIIKSLPEIKPNIIRTPTPDRYIYPDKSEEIKEIEEKVSSEFNSIRDRLRKQKKE